MRLLLTSCILASVSAQHVNPAPDCSINEETVPPMEMWARRLPDVTCEFKRTFVGDQNTGFFLEGGELVISSFNVCSNLNGNVDEMSFYGGSVTPSTYPETDLKKGAATLGPFQHHASSSSSSTSHPSIFYTKIAATLDTGTSIRRVNASAPPPSSSSSSASSSWSLSAGSSVSQSINLDIQFYSANNMQQPWGNLGTAPLAFSVDCGYGNIYVFGIKLETIVTFLVLLLVVLSVASHHRSRRARLDLRARNRRYARLGGNNDGDDDDDEDVINCTHCRYPAPASVETCPMCGTHNENSIPPPYVEEGEGSGGDGTGTDNGAAMGENNNNSNNIDSNSSHSGDSGDSGGSDDDDGDGVDGDARLIGGDDDGDDVLLAVDAAAVESINGTNQRLDDAPPPTAPPLPAYSESAPVYSYTENALEAIANAERNSNYNNNNNNTNININTVDGVGDSNTALDAVELPLPAYTVTDEHA